MAAGQEVNKKVGCHKVDGNANNKEERGAGNAMLL